MSDTKCSSLVYNTKQKSVVVSNKRPQASRKLHRLSFEFWPMTTRRSLSGDTTRPIGQLFSFWSTTSSLRPLGSLSATTVERRRKRLRSRNERGKERKQQRHRHHQDPDSSEIRAEKDKLNSTLSVHMGCRSASNGPSSSHGEIPKRNKNGPSKPNLIFRPSRLRYLTDYLHGAGREELIGRWRRRS